MGNTPTKIYTNSENLERAKRIVSFALPIIAGNILQQLYQITSAMIVGRNCGENSLAALGVASPIVSLAVFFMIGIGLGLTVLLAKYYGEGDTEKFRTVAYTARTFGKIFSIAATLLAIAFTRLILLASNVPEEIMGEASLYLYIIFLGLPATFLYNYSSSTFLAIGKPQASFYALAVSSCLNILITLLLVGVMDIGIIGAAIANVLAQTSSVIFCIFYIKKNAPLLVFSKRDASFERKYLKEIIAYSGTSAIQQSIFIIGRIIIQRKLNLLGVSAIAGYNAAANLESLLIAPADGISAALASLMALEFGKRNLREIRSIGFSGFRLCLVYSLFLATVLWFFSPVLIPLFLKETSPIMITTGVTYLRWMFFAYAVVSFPEVFQAFFRGTGQVKITVAGTIVQITIRVGMTYALLLEIGIKAVSLGTAFGWAVMASFLAILTAKWFRKQEVTNAQL